MHYAQLRPTVFERKKRSRTVHTAGVCYRSVLRVVYSADDMQNYSALK